MKRWFEAPRCMVSRIPMKTFQALPLIVAASAVISLAGDGRIELSQPDFAAPPYVITNAGSYVLTGNILVTNDSVHGIEIKADDVSIDLNGFTLQGPSSGSRDGISTLFIRRSNLTIRNGTIRDWGDDGVDLDYSDLSRFSALHLFDNGGTGLQGGEGALVRNCTAMGNGSRGLAVGKSGSVIDSCAYSNLVYGIMTSYNGLVLGCNASQNGQRGISASQSSQVLDCTVAANPEGISSGNGGIVSRCTVNYCTQWGIRASYGGQILDNSLDANGGTGISVNTYRTRIEGNNITRGGKGIEVTQAGNFIVRNTCSGNTSNFVITGTQTMGPIITATGTITNQNPWANFEF